MISAKGVKDEAIRKRNLKNAKDLVKGCWFQLESQEIVVQLNLNRSVSRVRLSAKYYIKFLANSDSLRPGFNERKMLVEQFEALEAAEVFELEVIVMGHQFIDL